MPPCEEHAPLRPMDGEAQPSQHPKGPIKSPRAINETKKTAIPIATDFTFLSLHGSTREVPGYFVKPLSELAVFAVFREPRLLPLVLAR
jgi:hypothetical protein